MWRKTGYSSATPLAPRMSRALRAIIERDFDVVPLQHGDVSKVSASQVFQSAHVQRQQLRLGDFRDHLRKLCLHQLVAGDGFVVELLADFRILKSFVVAGHGGAHGTPADPVACLRQAIEGIFQTRGCRQHVRGRHSNVLREITRRLRKRVATSCL